eukprot:1675823-Pleurochrysis_carterae.AAC.2
MCECACVRACACACSGIQSVRARVHVHIHPCELRCMPHAHVKTQESANARRRTRACIGGNEGSYEPKTGLAAATTAQRALSDAWIPALEIVTVCCSITCDQQGQTRAKVSAGK